MAEFTGTAIRYVSKSGNDANSGSDPNLPQLTIGSGWVGAASTRVGSGIYQGEYNLSAQPLGNNGTGRLTSDIRSQVILDGLNTGNLFNGALPLSQVLTVDGFTIRGYVNVLNHTNSQNGSPGFHLINSIVVGGTIILRANVQWDVLFENTAFFGTTFRFIGNTANFNARWNKCLLFDCTINPTGSTGNVSIISSSYIENILIQNDGINTIRNCCIRGNNVIISPNQIFNITNDPLFLGNPRDRFQFLVSSSSTLLGRGENGVNIGNVFEGFQISSSTVGWGANPASNTNTQFNSNFLVLSNPNLVTGVRESTEFDLGRQIVSPTPNFDGVTDFVNNVPDDNNALVNPNHITIDISYAGSDRVFTAFKPFAYNMPIRLDSNGRSTGEANFDWANQINQNIRYFIIRPTIRDNYNQA